MKIPAASKLTEQEKLEFVKGPDSTRPSLTRIGLTAQTLNVLEYWYINRGAVCGRILYR
jgi:hypothetical protein